MRKAAREAIDSAYRLEVRQWRAVTEREVAACLGAIRGGPPQQMGALREWGAHLVDSAVDRCKGSVHALITAHLEQHDTGSSVAARIRHEFVDVVCEVLPGAGVYVSLRGSPNAALHLRSEMEVRFRQGIAMLVQSIPDLVIRARVTHRPETRWQALRLWSENNPAVVAVSAVLAVAAVVGSAIANTSALVRSVATHIAAWL
ncbi:MAG: hypothetical protein ABW061_05470 [Polyangiaceae bacterium]